MNYPTVKTHVTTAEVCLVFEPNQQSGNQLENIYLITTFLLYKDNIRDYVKKASMGHLHVRIDKGNQTAFSL